MSEHGGIIVMIIKDTYYFNGIYYNLMNNNKGGENMTRFINMQFSIFGEYTDIKVTQENVFKLMEEFKGNKLLPLTVTNQNVNFNTGKVETESRISFISEDKYFNFIINNNRIDFNYEVLNMEQDNIDNFTENLFKYFNEIYMQINNVFKINGNRLALNVNILGDSRIDGNIKNYYNNHIKWIDFYKDKDINDISYSVSGRTDISIGLNREAINVITEVKTATNNDNSEQRLIAHFDLNTLYENSEMRFSKQEVEDFLNNLKPILSKLVVDFKGCDNNVK